MQWATTVLSTVADHPAGDATTVVTLKCRVRDHIEQGAGDAVTADWEPCRVDRLLPFTGCGLQTSLVKD